MKLSFTRIGKIEKEKSKPKPGSHPGSVHVWSHLLQPNDPFAEMAASIVSPDESARALKYHFERDRKIYLSGHVFIRKVISHYTELAPECIQLTPVVNTKPSVLNPPFPVYFNISHSGTYILVALGFDSDVGIDVEEIADGFDTDGFAENNYHPNECSSMLALSGDLETEYFYTVWTRKEAWLKLTGQGTSERLRELDFSGETESPKGVNWPTDIHMISWKVDKDYLATLASPFPASSILHFGSETLN